MPDSELYRSVVKSIKEFDFSIYGLYTVEDTKEERWAKEWISALANKIDKDYGDHVDGI